MSNFLSSHNKVKQYDEKTLNDVLAKIKELSAQANKKNEFWLIHFDDTFNFMLDLLE